MIGRTYSDSTSRSEAMTDEAASTVPPRARSPRRPRRVAPRCRPAGDAYPDLRRRVRADPGPDRQRATRSRTASPPSERELAERFGASRPTVSQALRRLSLLGMVEIRRGSGAYVLRQPQTMVTASVNLMLDLDQKSIGDLMQLRLWLETVGAEQASLRAANLDVSEGRVCSPRRWHVSATPRRAAPDGSPPTRSSTRPRSSVWPATRTSRHSTRASTPRCSRGSTRSGSSTRPSRSGSEPRTPTPISSFHEPIMTAVLLGDQFAALAPPFSPITR